MDEYVKDDMNKGIITITIEEYMFHANFRIDKEINTCALIAKNFTNYMNKQQQLNVNIDIKATQPITATNGNQVFTEGVILRKYLNS